MVRAASQRYRANADLNSHYAFIPIRDNRHYQEKRILLALANEREIASS